MSHSRHSPVNRDEESDSPDQMSPVGALGSAQVTPGTRGNLTRECAAASKRGPHGPGPGSAASPYGASGCIGAGPAQAGWFGVPFDLVTSDGGQRQGACASCAAARRPARLRLATRSAMALILAGAGAAWGLTELPTAARCGGGGVVADAGEGWLASRPDFPAGPPAVTMLAAPTFASDSLYASNGVVVTHSRDAGCTWRVVFNAATPLVSALPGVPGGTVTALAAPSSATQSSTAYVAVASEVAGVRRPLIYRTFDSGATWRAAGEGLPLVGVVTELAASDQIPFVAYARVEVTPAPVQLAAVYRTQDAGFSWARRGGFAPPTALRVHERRDNAVFGLDAAGVVLSEDAATTFRPALAGNDIGDVDSAVGNASIRLVAGHSERAAFDRSDDGGTTWRARPSPLVAQHVSMAPLQDLVAVSDGRALALVAADGRSRLITPELAPVADVEISAPVGGRFAVTGLADGVILRAVVDAGLRPVPASRPGRLTAIRVLRYTPSRQFPASLLPARPEVTLPAGTSGEIPLDLVLPRTPMPLDVVFHVDTTGSMQGIINGLRADLAGIVSSLQQIGLDTWFGLVDFKDYPAPYGGGNAEDYPYLLRVPVGPAGDRLEAGLNDLSAYGGGDAEESQLSALFQSTTGAGETDSVGTEIIAPGRHAGYRPASLRLAIVATDVGFHRGGGLPRAADTIGYPGPTFEQTARVMRRSGVFQVGLAATPRALSDLRLMAQQTRTFAPGGGVDCDGDGKSDLAAGEPLVCELAAGLGISVGTGGTGIGGGDAGSTDLGPAVVALAEALPNRASVTVRPGGPRGVAAVVPASPHRDVDLKADNELDFTLRLTCPEVTSPTTYEIPLAALAGGRGVAEAGVTLTCEPAPAAAPAAGGPEELLPLPAAAIALALPPAAPQPVVQPNSNLNPNPNANVNVDPQANAAPNAAAAAQEEHEHQLAAAYAPPAPADTTELAAVRHDRDDTATLLFVGATLALTAAAGAVATRRATQQAAAHCRAWH